MKKKPAWLNLLDTLKSYWPLLVVLSGIVGTIVTIPSRLSAVEKKAEVVEQKTVTIEQYIQATEEQKKLIQQSPPGWRWSEEAQQYVEWKDDPRLKKK